MKFLSSAMIGNILCKFVAEIDKVFASRSEVLSDEGYGAANVGHY